MPAKYKRIVIKLKNFFSGSKSWKISSKKNREADWHREGAGATLEWVFCFGCDQNDEKLGEVKKNEKTIIQLSNSFVEIFGIFRERLTVCSAGCVCEAIWLKVLMENKISFTSDSKWFLSPRHLLKFHRFFLVFHHGSALHFSRQWPTTKRELKHLSWVKTP